MNWLYSVEMLKLMLELAKSVGITVYSPSIDLGKFIEFNKFPEFNSRVDVGKFLHKFYIDEDWFLLLDVTDSRYGISVTDKFVKSCNGYVKDGIDVYLKPIISSTYGFTIVEASSKNEDTKLLYLTCNKWFSNQIASIAVNYIKASRARIKDCKIDMVGKSVGSLGDLMI